MLKNRINKDVVKKSNNKKKCQYCEKKIPHMMVLMNKKGDIHVHAPLANKYLMNQFMEAIIEEQNQYSLKNK